MTERNPARVGQLIRLLQEIWASDPDARLGQIIGNAMSDIPRDYTYEGRLYNIEDDELIERIKRVYKVND